MATVRELLNYLRGEDPDAIIHITQLGPDRWHINTLEMSDDHMTILGKGKIKHFPPITDAEFLRQCGIAPIEPAKPLIFHGTAADHTKVYPIPVQRKK